MVWSVQDQHKHVPASLGIPAKQTSKHTGMPVHLPSRPKHTDMPVHLPNRPTHTDMPCSYTSVQITMGLRPSEQLLWSFQNQLAKAHGDASKPPPGSANIAFAISQSYM